MNINEIEHKKFASRICIFCKIAVYSGLAKFGASFPWAIYPD